MIVYKAASRIRLRIKLPFTAPTVHAPLYAVLIRKKVFTLSHEGSFLLIFKSFQCEGLTLQPFTAGLSQQSGVKALNLNPSHLKQLEISKKRTLCERVNAFSGKKTVYIGV